VRGPNGASFREHTAGAHPRTRFLPGRFASRASGPFGKPSGKPQTPMTPLEKLNVRIRSEAESRIRALLLLW
jgi:hypothetical protein